MGCIYNDADGICTLWDNSIEMGGCDENGVCVCEDDPVPGDNCESYESNWTCRDCGADLNTDDCTCDEE